MNWLNSNALLIYNVELFFLTTSQNACKIHAGVPSTLTYNFYSKYVVWVNKCDARLMVNM